MFASFRKEQAAATEDLLVVFSSNGSADLATITDISDERIFASGEVGYAVPIGDTKVYIGPRGRIFSYRASEENVTDTKRLAALERSTVLKQITMFEKESISSDSPFPIGKIVAVGIGILLLIIYLAVK